MSSALQNRLVGTAIVVAIAVIFLPDLLDGKHESKRNLFVELPQKPAMKTVKTPTPFDTAKVKEAATRQVEVISERAVDENTDSRLTTTTETESRTEDVQVADVHQEGASDSAEGSVVSTERTDVPAEGAVISAEGSVASAEGSAPKVSSLEQHTVIEQDVDALLASAGWVVQLGSFRNKKNVQDLLNRLEKAGYRAFSRPVKTSSGTLTKVFVGPDLQKGNLDNALSHLKELTQLQGRVTPFTVQ